MPKTRVTRHTDENDVQTLIVWQDKEKVLEVNETTGYVELPHNPGGWLPRFHRGKRIPVKVIRVTKEFTLVEIQSMSKTRWKCFYYPKPVRKAMRHD